MYTGLYATLVILCSMPDMIAPGRGLHAIEVQVAVGAHFGDEKAIAKV